MLPYLVFCAQQNFKSTFCSAASSLHSTPFQQRINRSNAVFSLLCLLQLYIDGSEPRKMKRRIRLSVLGTSRRLIIAANRRSRYRLVSKEEHACAVLTTHFFSFVVSATICKNCQVFSRIVAKRGNFVYKSGSPKSGPYMLSDDLESYINSHTKMHRTE